MTEYRPELDGLRALAVLGVLLYHFGFGVTGGYVGVDVFFVLSGFLITSIIRADVAAGTFTYLGFWERRVRRLLPALTVVVLCTLVVGSIVLLPDDFRELGQSAVAQSLFAANVYFWRESGYFAGPSELKPLLHTWSLAVEEQFYLLMPLFLLAIASWTRRSMAIITGLIAALSLGWCIYETNHYPTSAFFLVPSRAWELLLGSLLSMVGNERAPGRAVADVTSTLGLGGILASMLYFGPATPFPGVAALLPCLGTAAIIWANGEQRTLVGRWLSLPPIVFVGLISYSLYLWHWPIAAFVNYLEPVVQAWWIPFASVCASFLVAVLSWRFVEQPFRRRQLCATRRPLFAFAACVVAGTVAIGFAIHRLDGVPRRFPDEVLRFADGRRDGNPHRSLHHDLSLQRLTKGLPRIGDQSDERAPVLAVIGDSHGNALMPAFDELCRELDVPAIGVTRSATIPLFFCPETYSEDKRLFQECVLRVLEREPTLRHVALIGRWTGYESNVLTESNAGESIRLLQNMGLQVWVVLQVPEPRADVPRSLALWSRWRRGHARMSNSDEYERSKEGMTRLFANIPGVHIVDPTTYFENADGSVRISDDGHPLFVDDDHLSTYGARQLKSLLHPLFKAASKDVAGLIADEAGVSDRGTIARSDAP